MEILYLCNYLEMKIKDIDMIIVKALYLLEAGSLPVKLFVSFIGALMVSPLAYLNKLFNTYIGVDIDFATFIVICISIDWITGMIKWYMRYKFDFKKMVVGLMEKVAISGFGMVLFNGIATIKELAMHPDLQSYLLIVGKLAIFIYVGGSAFNNMFFITGGKFPPVGWMNRMDSFEKTGNLDDLFEKKDKADKIEE